MTGYRTNSVSSWSQVLRSGATVGILTTFVYALLFVGYATLRSTLTIGFSMQAGTNLFMTMVANAASILLASLSTSLLLSLATAIIGMISAVTIRFLLTTFNRSHRPALAIELGVAGALIWAAALQAGISLLIGRPVTDLGVETYLFWLGLPALFQLAAGGAAAWFLNHQITSTLYRGH